MTRAGLAYELPISEPLTDETDGFALLPSPQAEESTPTPEFVEEVRENLVDPHKRLYLPGRRWHSQRSLSRIVPALLPTPVAWLGRRPENATADPERAASRENEGLRGKRSVELPDALAAEVRLLPTPTVADAEGGRTSKGAARPDEHGLAKTAKLLPTPTTQDAENCGGPSQMERNTPPLNAAVKLLPTPTAQDAASSSGRNPDWGHGVTLTDAGRDVMGVEPPPPRKLLPTPLTNEENPGAGGELRAALTHGPGRRNETGIDTMGRPNRGRPSKLLPTPAAADSLGGRLERNEETLRTGKRPSGTKASTSLATALDSFSGESTSQPSEGGSTSSAEPPHRQLTLGEDSNPDS